MNGAELPKFYETFIPVLKVLKNQKEPLQHTDLRIKVRELFYADLPSELLTQRTSTGQNTLLDRVSWGLSYLSIAGYVSKPKRAYYTPTQKGLQVLRKGILTLAELKNQPEYRKHKKSVEQRKATEEPQSIKKVDINGASPTDLIEEGVRQIEEESKNQLLNKLLELNPYKFEEVVLNLLKAMGYGDTITTNKSNDGGIDGVINEDKLGLEKIYIQAKRFNQGKVHETDIRNFIGAMSGDTNKGVFVTTSEFDEKAKKKADSAHHKIILVDGHGLVKLMYEYGVGVQKKSHIVLKEVDNDFFEDI